jgi:error-prone DNA polymerase
MERFLSPLRHQLPDIDVDVESARRTEVYERILARYGGERCTCVSMMDTYRARHGVRDVGAALGLPPGEVDALAKAFPHIRASQVRAAMRDLPELRSSALAVGAERRPHRPRAAPGRAARRPAAARRAAPVRGAAVDRTLLDRTPVESSWLGFPMSQFDKDDVEELGLLKLDVLGIRMQSAMQHAVAEVARVDGAQVDLDGVPRDDPRTFELVQSTRTLGCFQIESPGQRELVGKFAPRPSRTSSSTSRCSGPGRSRATWCGRSSRPGRAGRRPTSSTPTSRRTWRRPGASSSSTSRCCSSSRR